MVAVLLFWILLILAAALAAIWGGRTERHVAVMCLSAAIITTLVRSAAPHRYHQVEVGVLAVDLFLTAGLIWAALRTPKLWPSLIAALQCISTLAHLGKATDTNLWRFGYAAMAQASAFPSVCILLFGVWQHRRTVRHNAMLSSPGSSNADVPAAPHAPPPI